MSYVKLKEYETSWVDCSICLICPNCGEEIILDSQMESEVCDCGKEFALQAIVYVLKREEMK